MTDQITLSSTATVRDQPDVDQITITVRLSPGKTSKDVSPFVLEKAVMKFVGDNIPTWLDYVHKNEMKTL